jgi:transcription elongation factor Elf1
MTHYEVQFECLACGCERIEMPDDYTEDDIATCKECRIEFGTLRRVNAVMKEVMDLQLALKLKIKF